MECTLANRKALMQEHKNATTEKPFEDSGEEPFREKAVV